MRYFLLVFLVLSLAGCKNAGGLTQWMSVGTAVATAAGYGGEAKAAQAVKETLTSTSSVAANLMAQAGANTIPLPKQLRTLNSLLQQFGYGDMLGKLEDRMNLAARQAAAEAAPVFKQAISDMTVVDAVGLIGSDSKTALTDYFRRKTESQLAAKMSPVVDQKLAATGFSDEYQAFLDVYQVLPLTNKPNLDIKSYVVDKTLNGIYNKMAQQEVAVRNNPRQAGSALLQQFLSAGQSGQ